MPQPDPLDLPPAQESSTPSFNADLHGLLRVVLDKSWLIVSCMVLAVIGAAVYAQLTPRVFEATTTVQVEQEDAKVVKSEQVVSEDMRGLDVLNTVAQKLDNMSLLQQVLDTNHLLPPEGTMAREKALKKYERTFKTSLRRNTRLIDITVRNTNAVMAARLANLLVEDYLGQDVLAQQATTTGANEYLKQEAEAQKKRLEDAEEALQAYSKQVGSISLQQNQDIITPQLQDLSRRLTQSKSTLIQADGNYQDSLKMPTNIDELLSSPAVSSDPDVVEITGDVAKHENDFVLIRQRYREKHPKYMLAVASLEGLKEQQAATVLKVRRRIQQTLALSYTNALTAQRGLEEELRDTETNAMHLDDVAVRFHVLSREVESEKAQFDALINRLGETKVEARLKPERIRVIQPALVPELPAWPKIKIVFALALLGGLAVGLGISVVLFTMDSSFRTVEEAERHLALPVLGSVPKLPKNEMEKTKLVALEDSNSPGAEVFRTLRTTLSMLGPEKDRKTYLFTSSLPSEGKSFTSVNYAASLAQQGLRTLLIDIDLRRPTLEGFFTGKRNQLPGVTDYLLGRKKLEEVCIQHEGVAKLSWMPAGSTVPNPAELLMQSDMTQLLNVALSQFDRVVVDTAPVLPVSDTLLLASKVQTVVLVVQGCKTSRKAVERSLQLLNKANAPIGGIVLNLLPNRPFSGYYYSYYHGYGYGNYGYGDKKRDKRDKTDKTPVDA